MGSNNSPKFSHNEEEDEDDDEEIFLREEDMDEEIYDEEDLPDGDDVDQEIDEEENARDNMDEDLNIEIDNHDDAIHVFTGHNDSIYSVACNKAIMGQVATGGGDDVAYLWRIGQNEDFMKLSGHSDSVSALQFSQDGKLLASGDLTGHVSIWDTSDGSMRKKLEGPGGGIEWLTWHPRGNILLVGCEDYTMWMFNMDGYVCMNVFSGHNGSITCGGFSPDGKLIISGSEDASIRIWNPKNAETNHILSGHYFHSASINGISFHKENSISISGSLDKTAKLFNYQTGKFIGSLNEHEDSVESVEFSNILPLAITASLDKKIIIWDINTLQMRNTCMHEDGVIKVKSHPSNALLYSASVDGVVKIFDVRSGNFERMFKGHKDAILDFDITDDGSFILTGSDDHTARVFGL